MNTKRLKGLISTITVLSIVISSLCITALADGELKTAEIKPQTKTLYAPDGRSEEFELKDVPAQLNVGWYEEPVQILYAPDERSEVFKKSDVPAQLNVGWYERPVVTMYSWDGTKTEVIYREEILAYEEVGWCYGRPVKLYAKYGDDIIVGEKVVGYYLSELPDLLSTEPFVPMYALSEEGGLRTLRVKEEEVNAYKNVGWSTDKPAQKYSFSKNSAKNETLRLLKESLKRPSTLEIYDVYEYDLTEPADLEEGYIYY